MMEYKGYVGKVEFDDDAHLFHGEVVGIRDVVTFQGKSVKEIEKAFHDSVDDYLAFCKERGEEPDQPYSGKFVVRIDPMLHRRITMAANAKGKSLNAFVGEALEERVQSVTRVRPRAKRSANGIRRRSAMSRRQKAG